MSSIIENQKTQKAIETGTAFRHAYDQAKNWKAALWIITLGLALVQLTIAIITSHAALYLPVISISFLGAYVLLGSFGRTRMQYHYALGCTVQNFHDYLTMEVGSKPNILELPQSTIIKLSAARLKKHPHDKEVIASWWSKNLANVPFDKAKLICSYSTFSWESELRKKYQILLIIILIISILIPTVISVCYNFTIAKFVISGIAPFTPFISLILDECLTNYRCQQVSEDLLKKCNNLWENTLKGKNDNAELLEETESLMSQWQTYRSSTLPIFEWLYQLSRTQMEKDMVINADSLIEDIQNI